MASLLHVVTVLDTVCRSGGVYPGVVCRQVYRAR